MSTADLMLLRALGRGGAAAASWLFSPTDADAGANTGPGTVITKPRRAVWIVASEIKLLGLKVSRALHEEITGHLGLSLEAVSHWGVVIVDEGSGAAMQYELTSRDKPFRSECKPERITPQVRAGWTHLLEVGHTDKTDAEIVAIGQGLLHASPTYHLIKANCHSFVRRFLQEVCDLDIVDLPTLEAGLSKVYQNMGLFELVSTRWYSTLLARVGQNSRRWLDNLRSNLLRSNLSGLVRAL